MDVDDDVLQAAKEIAASRRTTAGKVLSDLARLGLESGRSAVTMRNGVPVLAPRPPGSLKPTMRLVNRLRDDVAGELDADRQAAAADPSGAGPRG